VRKILMLILVLAVPSVWLLAQEGHPGLEGVVPPVPYPYPPVVSGCLERSGFYYSVIGEDGTAYDLTGSTNGLIRYVGHEVEVTGKPTVLSLSTTMIHAASSVEENPALEVKTVKELAGTCSKP
jgi:hypothetical protein